MARRKRSMFKQINNVHVETIADAPDWSSFLKIQKDQPTRKSAYVDKVRISYVYQTDEPTGDQGLLFVASHDSALDSSTPANNDGQIIAASANKGAAGVISLDLKRRITIDYDSADASILELLQGSTGAPIYLHVRQSESGQSAGVYLVIETWGRWLEAESL